MRTFRPTFEGLEREVATLDITTSQLVALVAAIRRDYNKQLVRGELSPRAWVVCQHKLDSLLKPCVLCGRKACPWGEE